MKAEQLVTLIAEEVRKALREEIGTLLKEAVEYASRPELVELQEKPTNTKKVTPTASTEAPSNVSRELFEKYNPVSRILEATQKEMQRSPDPAFYSSTGVGAEESYVDVQEGLDLSKLAFLQKAKQIHQKIG